MADRNSSNPSPLDHLFQTLSELAPEGPLGIAVSGGSDSMALLAMARIWSDQTGRMITAVTVDHGLRTEAANEAQMVADYCAESGIAHDILKANLDRDGNVMAKAREARYRLMSDWATSSKLSTIALGHTMDDQAETVLMRLGRGAGVDGLSAMAPRRHWLDMTWIRPLLGIRRRDLQNWLQRHGITWADDPTNQDTSFDRIKVRQALDILEPLGVDVPGLADSATRLQAQRRVLDQARAELASRATTTGTFGEIWLDPEHFSKADPELQRRLLSDALMNLTGRPYPPRHRTIGPVLVDMVRGDFAGATLGGCLIRPRNGKLLLCREPAAAVETLKLQGSAVTWDNRWQVHGPCAEGLHIAALGKEGVAQLQKSAENHWTPPNTWATTPKEVLQTLPSVWTQNVESPPVLASVPPLAYVNRDLEGVRGSWTAKRILRHDDPFA